MLLIVVYMIEIIAIMQCIYCVYGRKMRINVPMVVTTAAVLFVVIIANRYGASLENSMIMYGIFALYCYFTFRKGIKDAVISTTLSMTIAVVIQFISQYIVHCIVAESSLYRTLCADVLALFICTFLLKKLELHRFKKIAFKKDIIFCFSVIYIFILVSVILLQAKITGEIKAELFLFSTPAIFLVFIVCRQRAVYQEFYEEKEKEVELYKKDKEKFEDFATNVRLKQHELNNHLMAMNALHYTKHTYEELVEAQERYAKQIILENKYNSLLLLYNSALPGFLYDKFKAIELRGVEIDCRVSVKNYQPVIPEYYLIEMLGILLDNAVEAAAKELYKKIQLEIAEYEEEYVYIVRNRHSYVPFDEISSWFQLGKTTKGADHGLGLYHLKCRCEEYQCSVGCRNVDIEGNNWIEFRVGTGRKA